MKIERFLQESTVYRIQKLNQRAQTRLQEALTESEINFFQALLLIAIAQEKGRIRSFELHRTFGGTKSQLSQSLSRLEDLHYIQRKVDSADGRRSFLEIRQDKKAEIRMMMNLIERVDRETKKWMEKAFA